MNAYEKIKDLLAERQTLLSYSINYILLLRPYLEFRYFFNAGVDKETGICDGEGSDVIYVHPDGKEQLLGSLYGFTPDVVAKMSDRKLEKALKTSYIPSRLD